MAISGCSSIPPSPPPIQRATPQRPAAGLPTGGSPRMSYLPVSPKSGKKLFPSTGKSSISALIQTEPSNAPAKPPRLISTLLSRPAYPRNNTFTSANTVPQQKRAIIAPGRSTTSPSKVMDRPKTISRSSSAKQPSGRILYCEADSDRDLATLKDAHNNLKGFKSLHQKHLNEAELKGIANINRQIETLEDRITKTDSRSPETLKFQREAIALKVLAGNPLQLRDLAPHEKQDSRSNLTILRRLAHAKDDLDRYVGLYREHLTEEWLTEMANVSGRIAVLRDQITHAHPRSPKMLNFQQESNALKTLVDKHAVTMRAQYDRSRAEKKYSSYPALTANVSGRNSLGGSTRTIYLVGGDPTSTRSTETNAETSKPLREAVNAFEAEIEKERRTWSPTMTPFDNNPIYAQDSDYSSQESMESSDEGSLGDQSPPVSQRLRPALVSTPKASSTKKDVSWAVSWSNEGSVKHPPARKTNDISQPEPISANGPLPRKGLMRRLWANSPSLTSFPSLPIQEDVIRADTPDLP
jgi:hypothetical protein